MKLLSTIILLIFSLQSFSQAIQEAQIHRLSEPQTTSVHYKARDYVEMLPGFSVDATTGITFIAEIDPSIILEAEYNQPVFPFNTNNSTI